MPVRSTLFVISAATLSVPGAALAQGALSDERGTFAAVLENDYFTGTDKNYTNGLRLSYVSGEKEPEGVSALLASKLFGADESARIRRGFAIGQSIFTPRNIAESAPLPDQHPYAGWLYGEYMFVVQKAREVDQFTLQAGVIGPSAGGEFVQNHWHALIGGQEAKGWDNQIGDEPGLVLSYDHRWSALFELKNSRFGADVTPTYGFSVGNIHTNARMGLTLRLGEDLKSDYGPPRVRPALAGSGYFSPVDGFSWYLFAGAEARAVAYDAFLDGRLFHSGDPSVPSKVFVGDFQGGLVTQIHRVQISYTYVVRTEEFDGQDGAQRFCAISLSTKF
jgi:lipid A 3-O-deacylase